MAQITRRHDSEINLSVIVSLTTIYNTYRFCTTHVVGSGVTSRSSGNSWSWCRPCLSFRTPAGDGYREKLPRRKRKRRRTARGDTAGGRWTREAQRVKTAVYDHRDRVKCCPLEAWILSSLPPGDEIRCRVIRETCAWCEYDKRSRAPSSVVVRCVKLNEAGGTLGGAARLYC